jgi:hypothetical protein
MIAQLPELVASVESAADPAHDVLFRPAHRDDPDESAAFASLVSDDVARRRSEDADVARRIGEGVDVLEPEEAHALLRVMNDARLVLASRAGAFERGPDWARDIDVDPSLAAVAWLGYVQSELVEALMRP